ncbi:cutinase family protein [Nocardia otitidiscaviarum]|uniref:cutinase family protein n=2 Tax=Nocardia otitidiscaviarum TaxID=1823 RepID=UPI000AA56CEB|nr:cutinase family protein [Nocardia otitidiscaviarum]
MSAATIGWRAASSLVMVAALTCSVPVAASADPEPAPSAADCSDVIALAVPGTWETNAGADRNTVPGMLGQVTGPLLAALNSTPATVAVTAPQTSHSSSAPRTTVAAPKSRAASVRAEQVPYVAQVGGPIAGMFTGNPLTLSQSRDNGADALRARAKELAEACPLSKFVVLGYSQGALIAGDFLSEVGNRKGVIDPSRILAGALLSDPKRSATADSSGSTSTTSTYSANTKLSPVAETLIGANPGGEGVLGQRDGGMGVLAERVTTMCAPNDTVCSLSGKSKVVAAVVPLLNMTPEDLPDYLIGRGLELVKNVAEADPQVIAKAAKSVITELTKLGVAAATSPANLPIALAEMVFSSTMLDDVAKVINMPEFDALVSLTKPDELIQQASQAVSYLLLDAHRSYASGYKVNDSGDTATQWIVKWLTSKIQAGL